MTTLNIETFCCHLLYAFFVIWKIISIISEDYTFLELFLIIYCHFYYDFARCFDEKYSFLNRFQEKCEQKWWNSKKKQRKFLIFCQIFWFFDRFWSRPDTIILKSIFYSYLGFKKRPILLSSRPLKTLLSGQIIIRKKVSFQNERYFGSILGLIFESLKEASLFLIFIIFDIILIPKQRCNLRILSRGSQKSR